MSSLLPYEAVNYKRRRGQDCLVVPRIRSHNILFTGFTLVVCFHTFSSVLFVNAVAVTNSGNSSTFTNTSSNHTLPTTPPTTTSKPTSPHPSTTPQPELTPFKLSQFMKSLHKIVEKHCIGAVNSLEMESFLAFVNRQILQGEVPQTHQHPLHFNSLYSTLTGCANHLFPPLRPPPSPYHSFPSSINNGRNRNEQNKSKIFGDIKKSLKPQPTTIPPTTTSTKKPQPSTTPTIKRAHRTTVITSTSKPLHNDNTTSTVPPTSKKPHVTNSSATTPGTKRPSGKTTSIPTTEKPAHKSSWLSKFFHQAATWFGRRKRDLSTRDSSSDDDEMMPFYSTIFVGKSGDNDWDSYHLRRKSIPAGKGRTGAYLHFLHMFRNMMYVGVHKCPKEYSLDSMGMTMVGEYLSSIILEELIKMESQGMYVRINDHLENTIQACVGRLKL